MKIAVFISVLFIVCTFAKAQSGCDCTLYPVAENCRQVCKVSILKAGTEKQLKQELKLDGATAKEIVNAPNRKKIKDVNDLKGKISNRAYNDVQNKINTWVTINNINTTNTTNTTNNNYGPVGQTDLIYLLESNAQITQRKVDKEFAQKIYPPDQELSKLNPNNNFGFEIKIKLEKCSSFNLKTDINNPIFDPPAISLSWGVTSDSDKELDLDETFRIMMFCNNDTIYYAVDTPRGGDGIYNIHLPPILNKAFTKNASASFIKLSVYREDKNFRVYFNNVQTSVLEIPDNYHLGPILYIVSNKKITWESFKLYQAK